MIPGIVAAQALETAAPAATPPGEGPYTGPDPTNSYIFIDFVNDYGSLENVEQVPMSDMIAYFGTYPVDARGLILDSGAPAAALGVTQLGYAGGPSGNGFTVFLDARVDSMTGTLYAAWSTPATWATLGGNWFFEVTLADGAVTVHEKKINTSTLATIYERTATVTLSTPTPFDLRLAATCAASRLSLSVNGGAVVSDTGASSSFKTVLEWLRFGGPADFDATYDTVPYDTAGRLHSFLVFNSVKADADLPALSAFP